MTARASFVSRSASTSARRPGVGFDSAIIDDRPGQITLEVAGPAAEAIFAHEPGGHRWQHVPPNSRHGEVHTSTVTVAVLAPMPGVPPLRSSDIEETLFCKAAGPGGQNVNKTATACRLRHKPSGVVVECCTERCQKQNRETALRLLTAKVQTAAKEQHEASHAQSRREQVGSGMRGDKVRTYRVRDDRVTDHRSGKKVALAKVMRGELELLA